MSRVTPTFLPEGRRVLLGAVVAGAVALAIGAAVSPVRAWSAYLTSAFYMITIALGSMALLAMLNVSSAGWSAILRRPMEALMGYLPVGSASMLGLWAGARVLYPWASGQGHAAETAHTAPSAHGQEAMFTVHFKHAYLTLPGYAVRMLVALGLWLVFWSALERRSRAQDTSDDPARETRSSVGISAGFLLVLAYSFSMASFDWVMSLDPHWASTIFALYNMAGMLVAALSALTLLVLALRRSGALPELGEAHLHDLGKLIFGMATFWAYLWLSQYLLIWYANIPEETSYYLARTRDGWGFLFWANVVVNWAVPFLALLPQRQKRSAAQLTRVSVLLLLGRWLDIYLMVTPSGQPVHTGIGVIEVVIFIGFAALFVLVVERNLRAAPLLPRKDPYLVESLHHHG